MNTVENGKGDTRRPSLVDDDELEWNWMVAFKRDRFNGVMKRQPKLRKKAERKDTDND